MLKKLNELRKGREEGFTLIELLVVIGIIGVLAAVALPIFLNQQKAATVSSVQSDVRNTVTNVATFLATDPSGIVPDSSKAGAAAQTPTVDYKIVASGDNKISVDGGAAAGEYTIKGENAALGASTYTYDAATGTYDGTGDFA